jgi:Ca-activated chloride channel family protein
MTPCPSAILAMLAVLGALTARPSAACDVALMLAVDVSGSIDGAEYRIQMDGTADALADPEVSEAIVAGGIAIAMVQWSAGGMQRLVMDWQRPDSPARVAAVADRLRAIPRAYSGAETAVGEAIGFAAAQFDPVADCRRKVIDLSGDGAQNTGKPLAGFRQAALGAGMEINAIAIEGIGQPISEYYRRFVIGPGGFVMTARGHLDYPRTIRRKILREIGQPIG